ncbi:MAG TPA: hypothetical protein VFS33_02675 [Gemmatimonadales bacterium]|nr:hypothetical protein [Gemmatimonadales bacterium]
MLVSTLRFVSLFLTALLTGTAFCQTVEGWGRSELVSEVWLPVQQHLYTGLEPVISALGGAALIATAVVTAMVRHRPRTLALNGVAVVCLAIMTVVWVSGLGPLGSAVLGWTHETMPPYWPEYRNRWEWLEGARTALGMLALGAQILSLMIDQRAVLEQEGERVAGPMAEPAGVQA